MSAIPVQPGHRCRWFVYTGNPGNPRERIPHTAMMRGRWPGYDVECQCGWETKTGGATRTHIRDRVWMHKRFPDT